MARKPSDKESYWALVKLEVHADHFSPAYSFKYFRGKTKGEVAQDIAETFLSRVDEAISYEEPDEEVETDRVELEQHLRSVLSRFSEGNASGPLDLKEMETSITIGYPSYDLAILADGPWSQFVKSFLPALEQEDDFHDLMEEYESAEVSTNSPEQTELLIQFQRLKTIGSNKLKEEDVSRFLNLIEEVVMNEVM
jgi:hypothetical protein